MLANYLGRKGRETCLKGVVVFSAGWDVFECTASLEKPLDRFLFNSYLTSCLQASVHRSARARAGINTATKSLPVLDSKQRLEQLGFKYLCLVCSFKSCGGEGYALLFVR